MLNIMVCDDSELDGEILVAIIRGIQEQTKSEYVIKRYTTAEALLKVMRERMGHIDIVFLDIMMEPIDGITLAKKLRQMGYTQDIVFITVSRDYALESYSVAAKQYLLKPYCRDTIMHLLEECMYDKVRQYRIAHKPIILKTSEGHYLVYEQDIKYIESGEKCIVIHTVSQGNLYIKKKLDEFHMLLEGENFLKTHRSFVVNMDCIKAIEKYCFKLFTGESVDIKKRDYTYYKNRWEVYVQKHKGIESGCE